MIEAITQEQIEKTAARVAESIRSALYYMTDLIEDHNSSCEEDAYVDTVAVIRDQQIKFIKPASGLISGFMNQYGVYFIQVIPANPDSMLNLIMEQGYHVVPINLLPIFKDIILQAHASTVEAICEQFAEDSSGDEDEDAGYDPTDGGGEAAPPSVVSEDSDSGEEV